MFRVFFTPNYFVLLFWLGDSGEGGRNVFLGFVRPVLQVLLCASQMCVFIIWLEIEHLFFLGNESEQPAHGITYLYYYIIVSFIALPLMNNAGALYSFS